MILKARNNKDFVKVLVTKVTTLAKASTLNDKIKALKEISLINTELYQSKDGDMLPTFRNRRFSLKNPITIGTHVISQITSYNDFEFIKAHSLEKILRSIFFCIQIRKIIQQIIAGDEALKAAIIGASMGGRWDHQPDVSSQISLFPVKASRKGIMILGDLPIAYMNKLNYLILLCSVLYEDIYPIPLFACELKEEALSSEPQVSEFGTYHQYIVSAKRDAITLFEDETIIEKMYNAQKGISYIVTMETIEEIEDLIISSSNNPKLLGKIMFLVSSLLGVKDSNTRPIVLLFKKILSFMKDVSIDTLVYNGEFSKGRSMCSAIFSEIIKDLSENTLFELAANNQSIIKVIDAYGVEVPNLSQYIYREQIRRYRDMPQLSYNVRTLLNNASSMESKQKLLKLVFQELEPET